METTTKSNASEKSGNGTMTKQSTDHTKKRSGSDAAKDLAELFEDGLKDIYWAEKALIKALPKMEKNATAEKLKKSDFQTPFGNRRSCETLGTVLRYSGAEA
ncbi:DUF892 family protein [Sphingobacterium sp. B29]|uniref:DUF892 family protein n=1 Tax=Sphingobacterium sp. B29 TaxID=1933220 RepID=UPI001F31FA1E|nr:DUF892 family protein [Sphingobacterium sp. B29]